MNFSATAFYSQCCVAAALCLLWPILSGLGGDGELGAADLRVMIEVQSTGLCIDNSGSRTPGTALQGWKCNPHNLNQRFALSVHKAGLMSLKCKVSGMCIDVRESSRKSRAIVVQNPCTGSASQTWKVMRLAEKTPFVLRAGHSGLCLTHMSTGTRGSTFVQTQCVPGNPNQKFELNG